MRLLKCLLLMCVAFTVVSADSIEIDGVRYDSVHVSQTPVAYIVCFPKTGEMLSVEKSKVNKGSVVLSDFDERQHLLEQWQLSRETANEARTSQDENSNQSAPSPVDSQPSTATESIRTIGEATTSNIRSTQELSLQERLLDFWNKSDHALVLIAVSIVIIFSVAFLFGIVRNLPEYRERLSGGSRTPSPGRGLVVISNPNEILVGVELRSHLHETKFYAPPNGRSSEYVPNATYQVYFRYANDTKSLYKGENISVSNNATEIHIVEVAGGNYGIHKVDGYT